MRQQQDIGFQSFLQRARNGQLTQDDVDVLNARVAVDLSTAGSLNDAVFAQTNNKRHIINRI